MKVGLCRFLRFIVITACGIYDRNSKKLVLLFSGVIQALCSIAADYTLSIDMRYNYMFRPSYYYCGKVTGISPASYNGTVTIPYSAPAGNNDGKVYGISSGAFSGSSITKLYVHDEVTRIEYLGACPSLKKIVLRSTGYIYDMTSSSYEGVSSTAFSGTHSDCLVYVKKGFGYTDVNGKRIYPVPGDLFAGRPIEWHHYHVKFNANGGSGSMPEQTIYTDETTNLTANTFSRIGYSFSGWATSASGAKEYSDKASVENLSTGINATVNLYAVWDANYNVKFNANGGTGTMANQTFVYGIAQNLTANRFSRDGYSFVGWATSADGTKVYSDTENVKNLTPTANGIVNLYAIWYKPVGIENVSAKQRYPWNGLVDLKFTITGTSGTKYDTSFIAKDMVGGANVAMKTIRKSDGTTATSTEKLLPGSYNWIWDAAADLPKDFKCERMTVTGAADISAFPYTVKFNANGGTGTMANQSFVYGTTKALTANAFTRAGYAFQGWATSASGGKMYYDKQSVKNLAMTDGAVVNLYAVWDYGKVQLWLGGVYWATMNIGADKPEDYGNYFWWGDTMGYMQENNKWITSDRSNSNFSFNVSSTPTYYKSNSTLLSEGWITAEGVLSSEHDAARAHWGGDWRMPTKQEFEDLISKCDWAWTTVNGVKGYVVRGKGDYALVSVFFPCAGYGNFTSLNSSGSDGCYWSSVPRSDADSHAAWVLSLGSSSHYTVSIFRNQGLSIRPVQSPTK